MSHRALGEQFKTRRISPGYYSVHHPDNPNHANVVGMVSHRDDGMGWNVESGWGGNDRRFIDTAETKAEGVDVLKEHHAEIVEQGPDHPQYPGGYDIQQDAEMHEVLKQRGWPY